MSTLILCPRCGGTIGSTIAGKRACTCSSSGSSAVATATDDPMHDTGARPGERPKLCCVCKKDVTHAKRMKDAATGRYWCVECGSADPIHKAHAMDVPCPECKRRFAPLAMMKWKDHYICAECYGKHTGKLKGKPGEPAGGGQSSKTLKLIIAVTLLVGAVAFYAFYLMGTVQ